MLCLYKDRIINSVSITANRIDRATERLPNPNFDTNNSNTHQNRYKIDQDLETAKARAERIAKPNTWFEKLFDFSKIIFSRESTYRGFVDLFAEDTPALLAEAFRGKAAFLEAVFKHALTTGMIFVSPKITEWLSKLHAKNIFGDKDGEQFTNYMLFSRKDLDSDSNFDKARHRIINDESSDKLNLAQIHGFESSQAKKAIEDARSMQDFMSNYKADNSLRSKINKLKDETIKSQVWLVSTFYGCVPLIIRLFRKYILEVDRFVGSMKYLSDSDADKLGNQKAFGFKQIFGTITSILSGPAVINWILSSIKNLKPGAKGFLAMLKEQMDTTHSFFAKKGLFISYGEAPYLISKIVNSQDMFERVENIVKLCVSTGSLMFGDRATNGRFAKAADDKFTKKHGLESGVFYDKVPDDKKGFWATINRIFPDAARFQHVLNRTSHDPKLEDEATKIYQNTFFKGFTLHAIGTFLLKTFVNWTTQFRVKSALSK